jgi:hypothetical protein
LFTSKEVLPAASWRPRRPPPPPTWPLRLPPPLRRRARRAHGRPPRRQYPDTCPASRVSSMYHVSSFFHSTEVRDRRDHCIHGNLAYLVRISKDLQTRTWRTTSVPATDAAAPAETARREFRSYGSLLPNVISIIVVSRYCMGKNRPQENYFVRLKSNQVTTAKILTLPAASAAPAAPFSAP